MLLFQSISGESCPSSTSAVWSISGSGSAYISSLKLSEEMLQDHWAINQLQLSTDRNKLVMWTRHKRPISTAYLLHTNFEWNLGFPEVSSNFCTPFCDTRACLLNYMQNFFFKGDLRFFSCVSVFRTYMEDRWKKRICFIGKCLGKPAKQKTRNTMYQ